MSIFNFFLLLRFVICFKVYFLYKRIKLKNLKKKVAILFTLMLQQFIAGIKAKSCSDRLFFELTNSNTKEKDAEE
jgi:hypothetical protein